METEFILSESERTILRTLAYGRADGVVLDWLAVYRLKQRGLVEDTYDGPRLTLQGKHIVGLERISPK